MSETTQARAMLSYQYDPMGTRFYKKGSQSEVILAVQYTGENRDVIEGFLKIFCPHDKFVSASVNNAQSVISTAEGGFQPINKGDFVWVHHSVNPVVFSAEDFHCNYIECQRIDGFAGNLLRPQVFSNFLIELIKEAGPHASTPMITIISEELDTCRHRIIERLAKHYVEIQK